MWLYWCSVLTVWLAAAPAWWTKGLLWGVEDQGPAAKRHRSRLRIAMLLSAASPVLVFLLLLAAVGVVEGIFAGFNR